jgi:chromosome segregation ATPase
MATAPGSDAEVSTSAETQNQALDVVEDLEITAPESEAQTDGEATETDADKALKKLQRRIDKRTADVYRTRAENEQLRERLARLEAQARPEDQQETKAADPEARAREISRVERFTEKANDLVEQGTKKHADFTEKLKALASEVGEFVKRDGMPSPFMDVILEVAEKPTELLYHLGKNPELAETLAGLNPIQLAKKLDRIERDLMDSSKSKTSNAPKPLDPVKGKAADTGLSSNLDTAEWMKRREEEVRAARGR